MKDEVGRHGPSTPDLPSLFRAADLAERGLPRGRIKSMLETGEVERIGRGLYRVVEAPISELETIAAVCKRVPNAIICLLTALHMHEIGTQAPRDVWIAIDRKSRLPRIPELPIRVVRFSRPMLQYAVEQRHVLGVRVPLTSPARTVIDCFRYRRKIGLDVALEALRDALQSKKVTVDELVRAAEVCRVRTVITPYLESVFV